jgi:hypothetical protein
MRSRATPAADLRAALGARRPCIWFSLPRPPKRGGRANCRPPGSFRILRRPRDRADVEIAVGDRSVVCAPFVAIPIVSSSTSH